MKLKLIAFLLLCAGAVACTQAPPATYMWDGKHIQSVKKAVAAKDLAYMGAYETLLKRADQHLEMPNPTVMDKPMTPASGDKHDYTSLSRYYWPNPDTPDGLPYVSRDGESNPELANYDRERLGNMADAVVNLSLAHYLSGEQKYADKAVSMLRTWFIDSATLMNPNVSFSQIVPGMYDGKGRSAGLIDTYSFVPMVDAIMLLDAGGKISKTDMAALRKWFADYAQWMITSENGMGEQKAKNNHSIAFDVQLAMYSMFGGNTELARKTIAEFPEKRLFAQIEPDGSQPQELRRAIAYWYSAYNLIHMIEMSDLAKHDNIDLFHAKSADGRSISAAIDFLLPFIGTNGEGFPYQQIPSNWQASEDVLLQVLYRAAKYDPNSNYMEIYQKYAPQPEDPMFVLLYK